MGLFKKSDLIRISPDDGADEYLINKVVEGANIQITFKDDATYGKQFVISCPGHIPGASDNTFEMNSDGIVPSNASLVLVDSGERHVTVTLPFASEYLGWLSIVCTNSDHGVSLALQDGDSIFNTSNTEIHAPGDALTFASNRKKHWYCVGKYAAEWYM